MTTTRHLLLLLSALLLATVHGFVPPAATPFRQQQAPVAATTTAAPAGAAVVVETLVLPMGDDTQLKIRFRQENFKTLALRTNQVVSVGWVVDCLRCGSLRWFRLALLPCTRLSCPNHYTSTRRRRGPQLLASFRALKKAAAEEEAPGRGKLEPTFLFEV